MRLQTRQPPFGFKRKILPNHFLESVFTGYLDLPCYLIETGSFEFWYSVTNTRTKASPMDFENSGTGWTDRVRYNLRVFANVVRTRKVVCAPHKGLFGIFVPVLERGNCVAILQSGVFLLEPPDAEGIVRRWKAVRGNSAEPHGEDFTGYVRSMLEIPVLDRATLGDLREFLQQYARVIGDAPDSDKAIRRMDQIRLNSFRHRFWNRLWVDATDSWWRLRQPPDQRSRLWGREIEELGITRFPTTVFAARREDLRHDWKGWLDAVSFQKAALACAQEMDETLAYPLSRYGVILLTSPRPGKSATQSLLELREKASWFAAKMSQRSEGRIRVGVGRSAPQWAGLGDSRDEALAALHGAAPADPTVIFFREDLARVATSETQLRRSGIAFAQYLLEHGSWELPKHREDFIQQVLAGTLGRLEVTRRLFWDVLRRLLESLEASPGKAKSAVADCEADCTARLELAADLNELVGAFETTLSDLTRHLQRPQDGDKWTRLKRAKAAVESSPEFPWTLRTTATRFGFSDATFSREFRKVTGLPLAHFLRLERLKKAQRLLAEGSLPLELVSDRCGFKSVNYFSQVFKKELGLAPGHYRRNNCR